MQLKNYNCPNHYNLDDGTTIKGTLIMTYKEWCEVYDFIRKEYQEAVKNVLTYKQNALSFALKQFKRNKPFSIGITGTFEIVKEYNLIDKYKNQNYAIKII